MPKEYEYRFNSYNKKEIISKLKDLGAKYYGTFKFRVMVFTDSINSEKYIRVRDEGHRITMTVKNNLTRKLTKNRITELEYENEIGLYRIIYSKKMNKIYEELRKYNKI